MRKVFTFFKPMLIALTILIVLYLVGVFVAHDRTFHLNEKYHLWIILQLLHIITSICALVITWRIKAYNKWQKIDQTIIIICTSIFGLWYWYKQNYPKYLAKYNAALVKTNPSKIQ